MLQWSQRPYDAAWSRPFLGQISSAPYMYVSTFPILFFSYVSICAYHCCSLKYLTPNIQQPMQCTPLPPWGQPGLTTGCLRQTHIATHLDAGPAIHISKPDSVPYVMRLCTTFTYLYDTRLNLVARRDHTGPLGRGLH